MVGLRKECEKALEEINVRSCPFTYNSHQACPQFQMEFIIQLPPILDKATAEAQKMIPQSMVL